MASTTPTPETVLEAVERLEPAGAPVTTPEVAEAFDCTTRTVYNKLDALVENGDLRTKKVGARGRVWWLPRADSAGRSSPPFSSPAPPHTLRTDGVDGEMADCIRETEWAETPLGPMETWPQELRVAVDVMLNASEAISIYWGADFTLLYNDAWRELVGDAHPEVLGRPAREAFPQIWDAVGPSFERVLAGEGSEGDREQFIPIDRGDGLENAWFDYSANPIPLADGSVGGVFTVAIDVTDRVQAVRSLREREERSRSLFESTDQGFAVIELLFEEGAEGADTREAAEGADTREADVEATGDRVFDYRFLEVNPAFEEVTGLADVEGRRRREVELELEQRFLDHFGEVARTGESARYQSTGPRGERFYDVSVYPYGGSDSDRVALRIDDITERKRLERELRTEKEQLDVAVENAPLSLFRTDTDLRYTWIKNLGDEFGDAEPLGKRDDELLPPDVADELLEPKRTALKTGERVREEVTYGHPDREVSYDLTVAPLRADDGEVTGLVGAALDITERKRREEERQKRSELDAFRVDLADAIRPLSDPEEVQEEAAHVLGEQLGVDRAHYGEVLPGGDAIRIHTDFYRGDAPSLVGEHSLTAYGDAIVDPVRAGETLVVDDYRNVAGLDDEGRAAFEEMDIAALVTVPLLKDGRFASYFTVNQTEPREWTETEVAMVEETAERTWNAVERARAEQALRESEKRYRTLFESMDEGFCVIERVDAGPNDPIDFRYVETNPAFADQVGVEAVEGKTIREVFPGTSESWFETYDSVLRTGESIRFEREFEVLGRILELYVFQVGAEADQRLGVLFQDVTDRKRTQHAIERLNDVSRELMEFDVASIRDSTASIVQRVLDVEYAALWRYDETSGELRKYASETPLDADAESLRLCDEFPDKVWQTFVSDEIAVSTDCEPPADASSTVPVRSRVLVPLGRHGVICAGSTQPGTFDAGLVDLLEAVAATIETAWDRAEGERELARQNEELTRLDQLNTLIRGIDSALVQADAVETIDEAVCDRLAGSGLYEFAWIGEYEATSDAIEPRAWAGIDGGDLDALAAASADSGSNDGPLRAAVETGEMQVVADIATDGRATPWRESALESGARSCLCIPLVYEESIYGVLAVYGGTPQQEESDVDVLAELGRTVAHAINAVETKATLRTDSVVELTLRTTDSTTPLCRLARELECQIELEGLVPGYEDDPTVFFMASGVGADEFLEAGRRTFGVEDLTCLVAEEGDATFRARVPNGSLAALLVEQGVVIRSLTVASGTATIVVDAFQTDDVRGFVDHIRAAVPDLELLARRTQHRPLETRQTFHQRIEDRLTDRQLEVLLLAYRSGFFQSPRVRTGAELSTTLDVSQSTFTHHLREAERRLCEMVFDPP